MGIVTGLPPGYTVGNEPKSTPGAGEVADYDSNLFQTAHETIIDTLQSATQGKGADFIEIAYTFGKYYVIIYVLWYAFSVLAGMQSKPAANFIWNLARMAFILMFVRNIDGYLDASVSAIYGLKDMLAGGDVYLWCDQLWVKTVQTATTIYNLDNADYVPVKGAIGAGMTYLGGLIALFFAALTFFAAEVTLLLLTVTAPLFIMCLMAGFLRQMFNSWLQLIFSAILVFMFGALALRAGTNYLNTILSVNLATATQQNLIYMGASALAGGLFMAFVIWQAKTYASQIAGVGAEGALQGAAAMGVSVAGFGAVKAGGATMGRISGAAPLIKDGARKGIQSYAGNPVSAGESVAKTAKARYSQPGGL